MSFLTSSPINPDDILPKIIPSFWPFITQLIAFIILFLVVFFLAYKPVKKLLKKRNDYIKNNITQSKDNELKSEEKLKEAELKLNTTYKEAKGIIATAKLEGEKERVNIVNLAKEEAKQEKLKVKEEIELEIKKSQDDIHKEMVEIALSASEKILAREVNDKDNKKRIDDFIKDIEKEK